MFQIKLHDKDTVLLKQIKSYFEIGAISINKQSVIYTVSSIEDLNKIIIPILKDILYWPIKDPILNC